LESLTTVGMALWIVDNRALPTCEADALVTQLVGFSGEAHISGNDDSGTCQ